MSDMTSGGGYSDMGVYLAQQCLAAVQSSIDAAQLDQLDQVEVVHGTGIPLNDVCDGGVLWARVVTAFPSNGDGQPYAAMRADLGTGPAWGIPVELGVLNCRTNIETGGAAIDPDDETAYAIRDGNYRMATLDAVRGWLPDLVRGCVLGLSLSQWTPIGPDGGISGGIVVVTFVTTSMAISADVVASGGPCT